MTFSDLKEKLNQLDAVKNAPSVKRIFHLSHNDLDGYGCHFVAKRFLGDARRFNSGYGAEIRAKLSLIESEILKTPTRDEKLLLISDLNISRDDCKFAERIRDNARENGHSIELKLLDHHKSGERLREEFDWYFLDIERSATKIVYDWCKENGGDNNAARDEKLLEFALCVNDYDIWKTDNKQRFEFGKTLNRLMVDSREISDLLFSDENNEYHLKLLGDSLEYIDGYKNIALDDNILAMKKRFLSDGGEYDTLDNLSARFVVNLLLKNRDRLNVSYNGKKGLLTYAVGNISVLGNEFLARCPDYYFIMDVGRFGNVSVRADGKLDVSAMAEKLFGGGGHENAAGGRIMNFKEIFTYSQLREKVESVMIGG